MKKLGPEPTIDPTSRVSDSLIGSWTWLGPNTTISESTFGDYSYTAGDVAILYSDVGKFCSIASHVRLNPPNHPMWRVTQHHATYRRMAYGFGDEDEEDFFNWRRDHRVTTGTTCGSATPRPSCPASALELALLRALERW